MIKLSAFNILLISFFTAACQNEDVYNERNYTEHYRGLIDNFYTKVYHYNRDTNYSIRKVYVDSLYQDTSFMVIKHFFHYNAMDGPVETYSHGKLFGKGFMKNNKRHGEFQYFQDGGKLERREFYNMGVHIDAWEYYYKTGILFKKVYYNNGKFVKQEIYSPKTGKLARTEYEQSWQY